MNKPIYCQDIKRIVEKVYSFPIDGKKRDRPSTEARFIFAKLCREFAADYHETTIARCLKRHRTSVIYYLIQVDDLWDIPTFREHVAKYYTASRIIKKKMEDRRPPAHDRTRTNRSKNLVKK